MTSPDAACSFCGKGTSEVGHLIAGPDVWICDGCVRVCYGIVEEVDRNTQPAADPGPGLPDDPVMADIARAQQVALRGERKEAERTFARLWDQLGSDGDPLHRVTLALHGRRPGRRRGRAGVGPPRPGHRRRGARRPSGVGRSAGPYASLHLNVATGFEKLGRPDESRQHLAKAQASEPDLPAQGYGDLVRSEISALRRRPND